MKSKHVTKLSYIDAKLQPIVVKVTLHKPINICSIYISPHDSINETKLKRRMEQIPKTQILLLLGGLNCNNTSWGCKKTNETSKTLKSNHQPLLLHSKQQQIMNLSQSVYSAIDTILCILSSYKRKAHKDLRGNDPLPTLLKSPEAVHNKPPLWKINISNMEEFATL